MSGIERIRNDLNRMRIGYRWMQATSVLACAAATGLVLSILFVLLDLLFQLGTVWCMLGFAALFLGVLAILLAGVLRVRRPMGLENLATRVERIKPQFGNRLINVIQFADQDERFAQSLLEEETITLKGLGGVSLFPTRWLKIPGIVLLVGILLTGAIFVASPMGYSTCMQRLLMPLAGIPPHSLTKIREVTPGATAIVKGNAVEVKACFGGRLPDEAKIEVKADGKAKVFDMMVSMEDKTRFSAQTPQLFSQAEYRVIGGDAKSPWFKVGVEALPALERWEAEVRAPAYCGMKPFTIHSGGDRLQLPAQSELRLSGVVSRAMTAVELVQSGKVVGRVEPRGEKSFVLKAKLVNLDEPVVRLEAVSGLEATIAIPLQVQPDQSPTVQFTNVEKQVVASRTDTVPLEFLAQDDYGVGEVRLTNVSAKGRPVVHVARSKAQNARSFPGRFLLDLSRMKLKPGSKTRFRLYALDRGLNAEKRMGLSQTITVMIAVPGEERKAREKEVLATSKSIAALIRKQQDNLNATRRWQTQAAKKKTFSETKRRELIAAQNEIRTMAISLLKGGSRVLGDLKPILLALIQKEMPQAVTALEDVLRSPEAELVAKLQIAAKLEVRILSVLKGLPKALKFEQSFQAKADLLGRFQKLTEHQRKNLLDTTKAQKEAWGDDAVADLADIEDGLADSLSIFLEDCERQAKVGADDFAAQLTKVHAILTESKTYEKMMRAAEQLEEKQLPTAIQTEKAIMKTLLECLSVINRWRVKKARDTMEKANKTLKDIAEKLNDMEERQKAIAEVTRDLMKRKEANEDVKDELSKLDEEQEKMKEEIEKMAQDLYQFPELPVANELNAKMREVYEDVEQAADSENEPAKEIAVQKEDSLLDAIKNTKERVEDVEMWLPDKPDNIKWDMESFDAAEFPDMPLVPLPDELEDLVGELLDQAEEVDQASQDSTGNNMFADAEMGWDVADGPMPNFSAKGKSGNAKPNDNEMTGRSGAGREGQSNGELVENRVKGLEGREAHARKTQDPLQSGQVTEEEDSTMTAKATGGGKLGGESEGEGMFGNAPRRDLHMQPTEKMQQLRQETEALYSKSRMLYLGNTSSLGAAASEMRSIERVDKNLRDISINRRVMRRLSDAGAEMKSGAVLNMPVHSDHVSGGSAANDGMNIDRIDEKYRSVVSDYYKNMDE